MKIKTIITWCCLIFTFGANAQTTSTPDSAKYHKGELTVVCGKVFDTHTSKNGTVKLNFGAEYPNNSFTAVIFPDDTGTFKPASYYNEKTVCVSGMIKIYNGKAEVILKEKKQLTEQR